MMKAIRAALEPSDDQDHVRVVCFMTDGYVGNDMEILSEVQKHPNARVFSFGIGSSVNRFLLDKMAEYGRGEVEYVGLGDDGSAGARRFHERMRNPLLTDIAIDWGGLRVTDVLPGRIPDLFSAKPVVVTGRYTAAGSGVVRLSGRSAGRYVVHEHSVTLPEEERQHDVLATFWARRRVDDLMGSDFLGMQQGRPRAEVRKAILQLGLEHRLMTQFTAFVAVEEMTVTDGGEPRRVDVPIEIPEGVSYEGVFGIGEAGFQAFNGASPPAIMSMTAPPSWSGSPRGAEAMHRMAPQKGKLDPSLAAVIERLRKRQSAPLPGETQFIRNGKVEVQIWLKDTLPETIARLKTTGAEIVAQPKTGRIVLARIPLDKLVAVADLSIVIYLAPWRGTS
jgi:Ca-activated chloride channel family protein